MPAPLIEELLDLLGLAFEQHRDETYRVGPIQAAVLPHVLPLVNHDDYGVAAAAARLLLALVQDMSAYLRSVEDCEHGTEMLKVRPQRRVVRWRGRGCAVGALVVVRYGVVVVVVGWCGCGRGRGCRHEMLPVRLLRRGFGFCVTGWVARPWPWSGCWVRARARRQGQAGAALWWEQGRGRGRETWGACAGWVGLSQGDEDLQAHGGSQTSVVVCSPVPGRSQAAARGLAGRMGGAHGFTAFYGTHPLCGTSNLPPRHNTLTPRAGARPIAHCLRPHPARRTPSSGGGGCGACHRHCRQRGCGGRGDAGSCGQQAGSAGRWEKRADVGRGRGNSGAGSGSAGGACTAAGDHEGSGRGCGRHIEQCG